MRARSRTAWLAVRLATLGAPLLLGACATGQYSYITDPEASRRAAAEQARGLLPLDDSSPGLLAAGGNALLPGVRGAAGADLIATSLTAPTTPLLATPPSLLSGQPLLGLSGGQASLLNLSTAPGASSVGANLSVAGVSTALQVDLTNTVLSTPAPPVSGGAPPPPPLLPVTVSVAVPGTTAVSTLISRLPLPVGLVGR